MQTATTILQHPLSAGFAPHPNSPWKALRSCYAPPYVLTSDPWSSATNVWHLAKGTTVPSLVTNLQPPIPLTPWPSHQWATTVPEHAVIIVCFHTDSNMSVVRAHSLVTGDLLTEVELTGRLVHTSFRHVTADKIALTVADAQRRPQIILYDVHPGGLRETKRIGSDEAICHTPGDENLIPLLLADNGDLLTSATAIPSSTLTLSLGSSQLLLESSSVADYMDVRSLAVISPTSIVIAVCESHSAYDFEAGECTIHCVVFSPLQSSWRAHIAHEVKSITHHPALGCIVALGSVYDPNEPVRRHLMTFLDAQTGAVLREEAIPLAEHDDIVAVECTSSDRFVFVLKTGRVYVALLRQILESGLHGMRDALRTLEKPEPYNAKARKAGDDWKWVDHVIVEPERLLVFPLRGPDFYVVDFDVIVFKRH
ncbi:hypothetical protein PLICRDRAFT_702341 [Plicaturopsis crispa FD-325 SS-3]|uniref:Cleavage/polyadenylation specificity factor A subunit N-terminal domain-containing protein n=1 Tax=Plicaturopsis crispa FD-325 SS-3 TaxID=944288 RepID=A0A0C9SKH9_PLICR|nr:hypothetical protein PLICRDRAFT_702341 [Plicaturopsis crispa FD-325 SS-3]